MIQPSSIEKSNPRKKITSKIVLKSIDLAPTVIGTFVEKEKLKLIFSKTSGNIDVAESENAIDFQLSTSKFHLSNCTHVQQGLLDIGYFSLMNIIGKGLAISLTKDLKKWTRPKAINDRSFSVPLTNGVIVPEYLLDGNYVMFLGGTSIEVRISKNAIDWSLDVYSSIPTHIAKGDLIEVDYAQKLSQGILICYRVLRFESQKLRQRVYVALLDIHNPSRVTWRSAEPVWEDDPEWGEVSFGGAAIFRSEIYSFWNTSRFGIMLVRYPIEGIPVQLPKDHLISLEKSKFNPVLFSRNEFAWESFATYNPAAFYADGRIHILYRAQGPDLISSIGYASTEDGVRIDERLEKPVYLPQEVFESYQKDSTSAVEQKYVSGGGIAGCEDPRITLIDQRVYMTYVAFDGASPPRVALTSIDLIDFLAKRWLWERPVLISRPGIVDKSAVIFPEKINGKYVIMHRVFPDILIDYEDDLNFDGTRWLQGKHRISIRENMWDSRKIGAGAPPLKTSEGWLLIYYGVDDRDDCFYKMGAMLLDLKDPTKVLYRSSTPILEPNDWYENCGFKPGIVYPCGAVILNEKLLVYYGGADCVVCVASRNLNEFLRALKSNHELKFKRQTPLKIGKYATHKMQIKSDSITQ